MKKWLPKPHVPFKAFNKVITHLPALWLLSSCSYIQIHSFPMRVYSNVSHDKKNWIWISDKMIQNMYIYIPFFCNALYAPLYFKHSCYSFLEYICPVQIIQCFDTIRDILYIACIPVGKTLNLGTVIFFN